MSNKYICDNCKKVFRSTKNLKYHTDNKVCYDKNNECKYCGSKFASDISMYRHIRTACKVKKEQETQKKDLEIPKY